MYELFKKLRYLAVLPALTAVIAGCGGGGADSPKTAPFYPEADEEWSLVWSDEFDGDGLDMSNWEIQLGDGTDYGQQSGWGNFEEQWYSADNIAVADGTLTITAKNEAMGGKPYTSGRIRTAEKFDFTYGRIEASVQAAPGQGLWNAFWMLPTDSPYGNWASSGEIDIMEVISADTENEQAYGTLHHAFAWPLAQSTADTDTGNETPVTDPAGDFHVYAVEWSGRELRWYVDGVNYLTVTSDSWYSYYYADQQTGYVAGEGSAPLDVDFHLLLNLAVGGTLGGDVGDGAIPSDMVVDYVRVYECSFDTDNGTGCNALADRSQDTPDAKEPFEASFDLYVDGAASLEWTISGDTIVRELAVNSFWDNEGALVFAEVGADDADRGTVIDIQTSNSGNISINAVDGEPTKLFGMGNNPNFWELHAGEVKFDLYVDSSGTDPDSSLLIKMDSGWPAVGFVDLKVADLPADQWTTVSVKVNDLLASNQESSLDTSNINSFFVLEPTSWAHVQVDNIEIACGHPAEAGCGIAPLIDDSTPPIEGPAILEGTWRVASEAGSLAVGPEPGSSEWWSIDDAGVIERDCYFDDEYVFGIDGSFSNVLGDETWIEPWQGGDESCAAPVFPHDGMVDASFVYDEDAGTFTINGTGAYVGLAKATNDGELASPVDAPASITYTVTFEGNSTIIVGVDVGGGVHWTYKLVKVANPPATPKFEGTWRVASEAGSLAVGPEPGSSEWWSIDDAGVIERDCYFDDDYVFGTDGTFSNVLGDDTWIEAWQSGDPDACGAPVFPHDGMGDASFVYDEAAGTLTLNGTGAYLGLAKATNDGELSSPVDAPASITYTVTFEDNSTVTVGVDVGGGVHWTYKLIKVADAPAPSPLVGSWSVASEAGSLAVGPEPGSSEWWSIDDAGLVERACYFNDTYVFASDGTFSNVLGDDTWIEAWQSGDPDACGAPVFPHDGMGDASYVYDEGAGTLTLNGTGAYLGLAKATNDGELSSPVDAPASITYTVTFDDSNTVTVGVDVGGGVHWTYKLVKN
jgi:beta-glucanase (GH16 family)